MIKLGYKDLKNFGIEKIVTDFYKNKDEKNQLDILEFQDRAIKSLKLALSVDSIGYNVYLSGSMGVGKEKLAKKLTEEIAQNRSVPPDQIYVYNFKNPKEPKLFLLESGKGKEFKNDINSLIEELLVELPRCISDQDFEDNKTAISKMYSKKREEVIKYISNEAKKYDFSVKSTVTGIYFMPIVDGVIITEEEYNNLEDDQKDVIMEKSTRLQDNVNHIMNRIRELDVMSKTEIEDLEFTKLLFVIGRIVNPLFEKYIDNLDILEHLKDVKEDILDNLDSFIEAVDSGNEEDIMSILPWNVKKDTEDPLQKYKVNLIVDNSELTYAPIITDYNPTYQSVIGEVEYDNEYGNFVTDFMKIVPGLLHKAHGGYLILRAKDLSVVAIEAIFRALKTKSVSIEPLKEFQTLAINAIKPQILENLDIKIILLGDFYLYDILMTYEDDFRQLFKIRGDFDYEINSEIKVIHSLINYIQDFESEKNITFTEESVASIVSYSTKLAGKKDKLTTNLLYIDEILEESIAFAKIDNQNEVTSSYVKQAIEEKNYRNNLYEEKLTNYIDEQVVMINTTGEKVGQINGLAVIDMDEYAFGKPTKITATSYAGKSGVINIEKESRLSGRIHDKGVNILSGYLGHMYAQKHPLSVSIRISFEQNYNGIDGDSASSTELYAIISSLSGLPITQEIAVTGSMNQYGEIQAIGGATEKIEGFFDTCKKRGLTNNQGVIIPFSNVSDLVLKDEVIEAVKNNEFSIYAIDCIDQGIELLMGKPAKDIHEKVQTRLDEYTEIEKNEISKDK